MLFASQLPYPVLVWNETNDFTKSQQEIFINRYEPDVIFAVGVDYDDSIQINRNMIKDFFPSNGLVVVNDNRTNPVYAGFIARLLDYRLVNSDNLTDDDLKKKIICSFDCNITNATELKTENEFIDYIIDFAVQNNKEVKYIIAANINKTESALTPRFVITDNFIAVPILVNISENYTGSINETNSKNKINETKQKINNVINKIKNRGLFLKSYAFNQDMFLILIDMPYGVVEDPWNELYYNWDGPMIYTDNLYSDVNDDGYTDLAVGRFCCQPDEISIQIENRRFWNPYEKTGLVLAEYREPGGLLNFDGMSAGFKAEWVLRSFGFNITRLVEYRALNLTDSEVGEIEDFTGTIENWLDFGNKVLSLIKEWKFKLYEYDINKFIKTGEMERLPEFNNDSFFEHKEFSPLIFYFGMGNDNYWFLPSEGDYNPYPTDNKLSPEQFDLQEPKIIFDEHSLSANPNSRFIHFNNLVFIGSTGISHNTFTPFLLDNFLKNLYDKPIGKALQEMKYVIPDVVNDSYGFPTSIILFKNHKVMLKDMYQKTLYGEPGLIVDPVNMNTDDYEIISDGENLSVLMQFNMSYKTENDTLNNITYKDVVFDNPDYYLFDYGKPVVPVFRREIILPTDVNITDIIATNSSFNVTVEPLILQPDQFSDQNFSYTEFPEHNYWIDVQDLLDGRKKLTINFAPVLYTNHSEQRATVYNATFETRYRSLIEILDFIIEDMTQNESGEISLRIKANGLVNISILIIAENLTDEINESVNVAGINDINIEITPTVTGNFTARLVIHQNNLTAGPRETNFVVLPQSTTTTTTTSTTTTTLPDKEKFVGRTWESSGPDGIEQGIMNPAEMVYVILKQDKEIFVYQNPYELLKIEKSYKNLTQIFVQPDRRLIVTSNSTLNRYELTTPDGTFIEMRKHGKITQKCNINCNLLSNLLNETVLLCEQLKQNLRFRIENGELMINYRL